MVQYRVLGPLHAEGEAGPIDIGPPKRRALLAALLLARGRVVSTDRLIDALWGDQPPDRSSSSLHVHISTLRKSLRARPGTPTPIVRQPPGYYLDVDPEHLDLALFETDCATARSAGTDGRWQDALAAAEKALERWRGPLLDDLGDAEWIQAEAARVDDLHNECRENYVTALLALDRFPEALRAVVPLRATAPYRERGCWLHMVALYRAGRGPEALDAFAAYSAKLADDLGLDPGQELRDLQSAILRQSRELARWPHSSVDAVSREHVVQQPASSRPRPRHHVKLVARDSELAAIVNAIGDSAAGASRWLLFTGPPGIGKTRLAEEAVARMDHTGGESIWITCPDERDAPAWWTMRRLTRAFGGDVDELFGPCSGEPESVRFLRYEKMQGLFGTKPSQPLMVVIDDVQWADEASLSCLAYLAGAIRNTAVTFVLTVRDGEHTATLELLMAAAARANGNRRMRVPALSVDEVAALANQLADEPVSPAEAEELTARTGGNPFFVQEYARLPRNEWVEVIPAVRSLLRRRLAGLEPAVVDLLRVVAVAGGPVGTLLLAEITGTDRDSVELQLNGLVDEQILTSARSGEGFGFTHGLLREELLAGMPGLRVQQLRAAIDAASAQS